MKNDGWIKLYRKISNSSMYEALNSKQRDVMMQCLIFANHIKREWQWGADVFECKPGQFITSLDSLKQRCAKDVSIQSVRSSLLILEKWQFLTNESTKTGRLITICNWDRYQGNDTREQQSEQQSANKELTSTKNVIKNNKEIRESEIFISDFIPLNDFEEIAFKFWKLFNQRMEELGIKSCDFKKSKVKSWVNDVRLMIEKDKRINSEINEVYAFIEKDDFWGLNIRSMSKLRKQFERILAQSRIQQKKRHTIPQPEN